MQCPNCSVEIAEKSQGEPLTVCPSCGSSLAPTIGVRFNPEAFAAGAATAAVAGTVVRRGARALRRLLLLLLLIVVAIVVAYVLLHH